ncbi:cyclase [Arthrobacter sp. H-02-3]|uniref:cyclase n=1 Tax=Arthrobacter sp. H-02-3 TaxID=2703675 RepID=UPI000DD1B1B1|nr:cyclase [Arthrobacter sp. H-02-3]PVZ52581.1 cyclase [Arthrobacter sp. H-02-3]
MALLAIQHRVADYDTWRKVYDSAADMQKSAGVTSESVHRMADDPDTVLVLHYFDSVEKARALAANPELKQAVQRSGIVGEPRIEIYE